MSGNAIVVGYDGTEGSGAALDEALRLAADVGGDVVVVFAYDRVIVGGESHDLDAVVAQRGHDLLAAAVERGRAAGIGVSSSYREESAASALVAVADHVDARYIVVGSYGERPLKGALLGSTPYKLLHLSERPVVVVRLPG